MTKVMTQTPSGTGNGSEAMRTSDPHSQHQITALLLDVLRSVNREVKTGAELNQAAHDAVTNYEAIARDLATPTDPQLLASLSSRR